MKDLVLPYFGQCDFGTEKLDFEFDGRELVLYLSEKAYHSLVSKEMLPGFFIQSLNPFPSGIIFGTIKHNKEWIVFFFDERHYSSSSKHNKNGAFYEAKVFVKSYFLFDSIVEHPIRNVSVVFQSQQYYRFLDFYPVFLPSTQKGILANYQFCDEAIKNESRFRFHKNKIKVFPSYRLTTNSYSLGFYPALKVEIEGVIDLLTLNKIVEKIQEVLQFAFMRKDIYPDKIAIEIKGDKDISGELQNNLYICKEYLPEKWVEIWRDSIPWSLLKKHFGRLFHMIWDSSFAFDFIPEKKEDRLWINNSSISRDSSFFESLFFQLIGKGLPSHSQDTIEAQRKVEDTINSLISTTHGKEKSIYKNFLKHLQDDPLMEKMNYCFQRYEKCYEWLKEKIAPQQSWRDISVICSSSRNDVDHGNKGEKQQLVVEAFMLLRSLIYSMILKKAGFSSKDINDSIRCLYLCHEIGS